MEQMPPIPSLPIAVQAVPKMVVPRDRMDRIVDYLKCSTNEVDGNVSVCRCI
jgi:hypothetical protein